MVVVVRQHVAIVFENQQLDTHTEILLKSQVTLVYVLETYFTGNSLSKVVSYYL